MLVKVKKTGQRGLTIYLPKSLGYKVGEFIELPEKKIKSKAATVEYVDSRIDCLREELTSRRF